MHEDLNRPGIHEGWTHHPENDRNWETWSIDLPQGRLSVYRKYKDTPYPPRWSMDCMKEEYKAALGYQDIDISFPLNTPIEEVLAVALACVRLGTNE